MASPLADILIGGLTEANKKRRENEKLKRNLQNALIKGQTAKQDAGDILNQIKLNSVLGRLQKFQGPQGQQGQQPRGGQPIGQPQAIGQPGQQPSFPTPQEQTAQQSLVGRGIPPPQIARQAPQQPIAQQQGQPPQIPAQVKQEPFLTIPDGMDEFGLPKTKTVKNPSFVSPSVKTKDQFDMSNRLQDDFASQSSDFFKIQDSFSRIIAAGANPSAAGDLALIFNYMKMLDPGSVVRESEFRNAQNSAGVPERIRAQYNSMLRGERLTRVTRKDFLDRAQSLFRSQSSIQGKRINIFDGRAKRFGLNKDDVTQPIIELKLPNENNQINAVDSEIDAINKRLGELGGI